VTATSILLEVQNLYAVSIRLDMLADQRLISARQSVSLLPTLRGEPKSVGDPHYRDSDQSI
jgi:hypothetical protein